MSNVNQNFASVRAELAERSAAATAQQQRRTEVERTISQLIAEQQLDGVDHSRRLDKLRAELGQLEDALSTWPAVEAELQRRLEVARVALAEAKKAELLQELAQLRADELAGRQRFAEAGLQFVEVATTLKQQLDRKLAIKAELLERGQGVDVGDPELPVFYPGWLRSDGGLVEARRSLVK